jgi:hypothetical protein
VSGPLSCRRAVRPALLIALFASLGGPSLARAADPPPPPGSPAAQAISVTDRVVSAWTRKGQQKPDGEFLDYILDKPGLANRSARDHYGPAMLGVALVLDGLRTGTRSVVLKGLSAVRWAAKYPWGDKRDPWHDKSYEAQGIVFEDMALSVGYDEAWAQLANDAAYKPYVDAWVARLKRIRNRLYPKATIAAEGTRPYYNWYLVEGLAVAALWDLSLSGPDHPHLASTYPGAVLAHPETYVTVVVDYLNSHFGGDHVNYQVTNYGGLYLGLLSDPPENPPAYDILSLALFSKIVAIVSTKITEGRTQLNQLGLGAWALMAPDGDVSWFGRSQEQSWTLAMASSGMFRISRTQGIERPDAGRMRAAGARALVRLQSSYLTSKFPGMWIAPVLQHGVTPRATNEAMDPYATAAGYTGLTLLGLEWVAQDAAAAEPTATEGIAADAENGGYRLGTTNGSFIMRRTADVWFSVKSAPAVEGPPKSPQGYSLDLRYESGLTAVQVHDQYGWHRLMPPRPNTHNTPNRHAGYDPVGPVLVTRSGVLRSVGGTAEKEDSTGGVVLSAKYAAYGRTPTGQPHTVHYQPVGCGVQIIVDAHKSEKWRYSAFFDNKPTGNAFDGLTYEAQKVRAWGPDGKPGRILILAGDSNSYASGEQQNLYRRRFEITAAADGPVTFQVCRPGQPGA